MRFGSLKANETDGRNHLVTCLLVGIVLCNACGPAAHENAAETTPGARRITDWPGSENSARFSPDARHVAFEAVVDGATDIYVLDLASGVSRRVTDGASSNRSPTWSPDGKRLAFQSDRSGALGIWALDVDGGEPTPIYVDEGVRAIAPDWSPDGSTLAMTVLTPDATRSYGFVTPWVVGADGTGARSLTDGGDEWRARFTADGEWLVYYLGRTDDIEAVNVANGEVQSITRGDYVGWRPELSPEQRRVAFVSAAGGRWSVWVGSRQNTSDRQRISRSGSDDYPSWSPDGRAIVYSSLQGVEEIFEIEVDSGQRTPLGITGSSPQTLADGAIAYLSDDVRPWDLIVHSPDGTDRLIPIDLPGLFEFRPSPDGTRWALTTDDGELGGQYDVYTSAADGSGLEVIASQRASESPVWCADGTILFSSSDGYQMVFRQVWRAGSGDDASIVTTSPKSKRPTDCAADGRILLRYTAGSRGLYVLETHDGELREMLIDANGTGGRFSPDGARVAYIASVDGQTDIYVWSRETAKRQLTNDAAVESIPSWTADGKRLVFSAQNANRDLWIAPVPPSH